MQDGSYRVSLRVGAPTLNDTFVFPKILNAKFNFIYIAINQILTDFFLIFFAIFLFSAQKNCTFAPALRKKAPLVLKTAIKDDSPWSKLMTGAAHQ